jgi:hypothetical protein
MSSRTLARHAKRIMQRRASEKKQIYRANVAAGYVKGPLVKLHESGRRHPWRECPVCVIAYIRATNS